MDCFFVPESAGLPVSFLGVEVTRVSLEQEPFKHWSILEPSDSLPFGGPGVAVELLMLRLLLLKFHGERIPRLEGVGGEKGNLRRELG